MVPDLSRAWLARIGAGPLSWIGAGLLTLVVAPSIDHGRAQLELVPEAAAAEPETTSVRRFALLVGANDGGSERERLLYAGSDVAALGKVLDELGGVDERDRIILEDPGAAALERGFAEISSKIAKAGQAGQRVQFIFYYSGHSDEAGLLLGGVHVDYKSLRVAIDQVPADVRIAILDSCSSGAFTRHKGGRKQAPFLLGGASEVQGHAYLTSSSADEAAQESDRIGGSFFTHFLVTGLRGAADVDGDRQVTLDEAYRFAFDETLARTETSAGGPQHAAYDIQLAGTGELVMTDLRKTSAKLEIAGDLSGRIYVRDRRGNLVAELYKPKGGGTIVLALEPGNYAVTLDDGRELHKAEVAVRSGKAAKLALDGFEEVPIEGTRLRGDAAGPDDRGRPPPPPGGYRHVPVNIGVTPGAEINTAFTRKGESVVNGLSLGLLATGSAGIGGMQGAIGAVWTRDYAHGWQAAVGATIARGPMNGVQTAIGLTLADDLRGLQLGAVNLGRRRVAGVQLGAVNVVRGTGPRSVRGVQAGLVNVAKGSVRGMQVGLINIADEADVSLALIPYTKQGGIWFDLWTSDVQLIHAALRFRARKSYTFFTAGLHPIGGERSSSWSAGLGLGGPLVWRRRVSLELDNAISVVGAGPGQAQQVPWVLDTLRLSLAYRPARHFAIWGAVTGNALFDPLGREDGFRPGYSWWTSVLDPRTTDVGLKLWPGFAVGFEF